MSSLRPATVVPSGNDTSLAGYWGQVFADKLDLGEPVSVPVTDRQGGTFYVPYYVAAPQAPVPPSYSFGTPTGKAFIATAGEEESVVGQTYRVNYDLAFTAFQDWQAKALEAKWRADDRVKVHYVALHPEQKKVIVEFTLLKPSSPIMVVAVALAIAVVGVSLFLTVRSLEKTVAQVTTVDTPVGKVNFGGLILLGFLGVAAYFLLPKLRTL